MKKSQISDTGILYDMLQTEEYKTVLLNSGLHQCTGANVYTAFLDMLADTENTAFELKDELIKRGEYKTVIAPKITVDTVRITYHRAARNKA